MTLIGERHQQSLQAYRTTNPGQTDTPVPVVHCMGGAGRTGMVISAMQISAEGNPYSLQRIVMDLRRQRSSNSVQTEAQLNALVDYAQQRGTPLMHNWNGYDITARLGLFAEGIDEQTGRINAFRYNLKDSTGDDTPAQRALLSRFDTELITLENKLSEAGQQLSALAQDPDFVAMSDAQKIQRMHAQLANLYLHSADDLQRKIHGIGMPHGDEELAMAFSELLDGQRDLHAQRHYLLPAQEAGAAPRPPG